MNEYERIKQMLDADSIDEAITELTGMVAENAADDQAYYLLGNAYCRRADWKHAIDSYCHAIEINPDSPAVEAYKKAQEILNFYCHDLFNP